MAATKEQERKALQQIRKIVEDLGEGSYIGMAFEGVWEIAEENIENDFGNSCKWYVESFHEAEEKTARILDSYGEKSRCLKERIKELEDELARKESIISEQEMKIQELETALNKIGEEKFDRGIEIHRLKEDLGFAQQEIVKLKAKLFDLMFKGD